MKLYRWLLHFYPASFRMDYDEEMSSIFSLQLASRRGPDRVRFWIATLLEVFLDAARLHLEIARRDVRHGVASLLRSPMWFSYKERGWQLPEYCRGCFSLT